MALVLVLVACKDDRPRPGSRGPRPDARVRPDAGPPPDAYDNLPKADVLGPVHGELTGGRAFTPEKVYLWVTPQGAELAYNGKADGGPCEHQFAPDDDDLYLSVHFPARLARTGGAVTATTKDVMLTWKKPTFEAVDQEVSIFFDAIDAATGRAKGRMSVSASDGMHVAGAFDAALCVSPQRDLPAGELHGRAWGDTGAPAKLPADALEAIFLGERLTAPVVELIDASRSLSMQHELHIYRDAPATPCTLNLEAGFTIALGEAPIATGYTLEDHLEIAHARGEPYAVVTWQEPVGAGAMEGSADVSLILDQLGDTEVRGRVLASFEDPSKSMVVGAFTGKRCR